MKLVTGVELRYRWTHQKTKITILMLHRDTETGFRYRRNNSPDRRGRSWLQRDALRLNCASRWANTSGNWIDLSHGLRERVLMGWIWQPRWDRWERTEGCRERETNKSDSRMEIARQSESRVENMRRSENRRERERERERERMTIKSLNHRSSLKWCMGRLRVTSCA
jgi:hypothetical protein